MATEFLVHKCKKRTARETVRQLFGGILQCYKFCYGARIALNRSRVISSLVAGMKSKVPKTCFVSVTKTDVALLAKQTKRIRGLEKVLFLAPSYVRSTFHVVQTVVVDLNKSTLIPFISNSSKTDVSESC